jgi:hypothetical protein
MVNFMIMGFACNKYAVWKIGGNCWSDLNCVTVFYFP